MLYYGNIARQEERKLPELQFAMFRKPSQGRSTLDAAATGADARTIRRGGWWGVGVNINRRNVMAQYSPLNIKHQTTLPGRQIKHLRSLNLAGVSWV